MWRVHGQGVRPGVQSSAPPAPSRGDRGRRIPARRSRAVPPRRGRLRWRRMARGRSRNRVHRSGSRAAGRHRAVPLREWSARLVLLRDRRPGERGSTDGLPRPHRSHHATPGRRDEVLRPSLPEPGRGPAWRLRQPDRVAAPVGSASAGELGLRGRGVPAVRGPVGVPGRDPADTLGDGGADRRGGAPSRTRPRRAACPGRRGYPLG